MKYFASAAAALFLLAAPAFAQSDNNTNNGAGSNDTTGSTSSSDSRSGSCSKQAPGEFNTFNEECRREIDIWVQKQNSAEADYKGDVAVGSELPGTVELTEVPAYSKYGYAMLNGKRVLIDLETRKVVHVY